MRVGELLGPYALRKEIGKGGIAAVFVGENTQSRVPVVLKVLRPEFVAQPATLAIFLGEPHALQAVEHENTLEVIDVVESAAQPYFVTELLRGRTLAEALRRGPLPLPRATHIARQIAQVLAHAHDVDVVHRSLKPANVFLVNREGSADFVKLLELGAIRMQSEGEKPVPGTLIGTPAYMAPEQLRQTAGDSRVDMYSFGVLLFELAVGRRPFVGELADVVKQHLLEPAPRARSLSPAVPDSLDALIAQCLEKDPKKRPPSMHEVSLALSALADSFGAAPQWVDDGPGPSVAVPKNTSGYTTVGADIAVAADATAAPPPILAADDEEPSFESVTDERPRHQSKTASGEGAAPEPVQLPATAAAARATSAPAPVPTLTPAPPARSTAAAIEIDGASRAPKRAGLPLAPVVGALAVVVVVVALIVRATSGDDAKEHAAVALAADAGAANQDARAAADAGVARGSTDVGVNPTGAKKSGATTQDKGGGKKDTLVSFTSTPAGAQVWIRMDKRIRLLCKTPCSFPLPVGENVLVELRLDGYQSVQKTLTIADGEHIDRTLRHK